MHLQHYEMHPTTIPVLTWARFPEPFNSVSMYARGGAGASLLAQEDGEVRTRRLWNTALMRQRPGKPAAKSPGRKAFGGSRWSKPNSCQRAFPAQLRKRMRETISIAQSLCYRSFGASWPGNQTLKIATAGFHGKEVRVAPFDFHWTGILTCAPSTQAAAS